ncbi:hypothetical protein B0T25DRAFT_135623 [Lasiosphaeria hispida]|uniref:Uncharacterized protein n=1 Tax=Lasiosphaeria hispida TaxID=260671 RepID=A0AAJ0HK76_9PEZI|nr:hypothetical protein B0T25DRAFT_135623 [Lasiosphaeria hispida]
MWRLRKKLNLYLARSREREAIDSNITATSLPDSDFTLVYCFYVVMGGFVVNVEDMHNTLSLVTLEPAGILALARQGHYFAISDDFIKDKSKSDVIGKTLFCVQAIWMLIQCGTRWKEDLPLTLLELHTAIQACFALIMYIFWFNKPLNVGDPHGVGRRRVSRTAGSNLLNSDFAGDRAAGNPVPRGEGLGAERKRLEFHYGPPLRQEQAPFSSPSSPEIQKQPAHATMTQSHSSHDGQSQRQPAYPLRIWQPGIEVALRVQTGERLPGGVGPSRASRGLPIGSNLSTPLFFDLEIELSSRDRVRWERAAGAIRRLPDFESLKPAANNGLWELIPSADGGPGIPIGNTGKKDSFAARSRNFGDIDGTTVVVLTLMATLYGGLHLVPWKWEFATRAEWICWIVSCFGVMGVLFVMPLLTSLGVRSIIHFDGPGTTTIVWRWIAAWMVGFIVVLP